MTYRSSIPTSVLILALSWTAAAQSLNSVYLVSGAANPGSNFEVELHAFVGLADLGAYRIDIHFDPNLLQPVTAIGQFGVTAGTSPLGAPAAVGLQPGVLRIIDLSAAPVGAFGDVHLATITFHRDGGCAPTQITGIVHALLWSGGAAIAQGPYPVEGVQLDCSPIYDGEVIYDGPGFVHPLDPVTVDIFADLGAAVLGGYLLRIDFDPAQAVIDSGMGVLGITPGAAGLGAPDRVTMQGASSILVLDTAPAGAAFTGLVHLATLNLLPTAQASMLTLEGAVLDLVDAQGSTIGAATPRAMQTFVMSIGTTCGDANLDGHVDVLDSLVVAREAAGLGAPFSLPGASPADVDGNGIVQILDSLRIAQYAAGLQAQFACP